MLLDFLKIHVVLKHSLTLGVLQHGQRIPWLHPCLHGQPEFYNQIVTEIEHVLVICSRLYLQHKHTAYCNMLEIS
jgi:hypothetical protein